MTRRHALAAAALQNAQLVQMGIVVRASRIDGRGCFASRGFVRREKVAELIGERITRREAERRSAGKRRIRICDVDGRSSIDAGVNGDATAFINHSCDPNLFMRVMHGHVLFFALRDIRRGEELTLDYEQSPHSDTKRCRCGARSCRGTINRPARR
jgi:SET domain-containing protein